jgi:hypothetical protein
MFDTPRGSPLIRKDSYPSATNPPPRSSPLDSQSTTDAVRRDILVAFEYCHLHDAWVTPLAEALDGITAARAAVRPNPDSRSIWEIVLHLAVWNENIVERMHCREQRTPFSRPAEGAWPPLPAIQDESAWQAARQRLWDSLAAVRSHIETTPLDAMLDPGTVGYSQLGDLFCRFTHLAYHIGQITKLKVEG